MTVLFVVWILQDFAQLLMMGICMVPDAFMLLVLLFALLPPAEKGRQSRMIWAAFIGGLVWDLRWTNLPGLSAALGGGIIGLACVLWQQIPVQGRSMGTFAMFAVACELLYATIHCFFWTIPSLTAIRLFTVQQLMALPVIILVTWLFSKAVGNDD